MADDVNTEMVNDFFADSYDPVDPSELSGVDNSQGQSQQHSQNHKSVDQTPNANPAKTQVQQPNTQQKSEPAQPVNGFDDQFFAVEKNGTKIFDAQKALDFMNQNSGFQPSQKLSTVFNPVAQTPAQQAAAVQQQAQADNRPEWEKQYEEEMKAREQIRNQRLAYRNFMQKALDEGYTGDALLERANQLATEDAEKEFLRTTYERKYKQEQEAKQRQEEQQKLQQIEPQSRVNLAKVSAEFGGAEKLQNFLFGTVGADGKLVNGFGVDTITMLFDIAHEGKQLPSDPAQMQDIYAKWWTKFTSNENNLRYVVDQARAKLQMALYPKIVDHINSVRDNGNRITTNANQPPVSAVNRGQAPERDALDSYFDHIN